MTAPMASEDMIELTAQLVSAFVSNNAVPQADLAGLIGSVHNSLAVLTGAAEPPAPVLVPAVPIKKSIHPDYIVCLENGKRFKSLKRHLATEHGLTPDEYRRKWGLAADYPMVAPAYAAARSALAKEMGLGRKRKKAPARGRRKA